MVMRTSFILDGGVLTGFLGMPVHPFVWVPFVDRGIDTVRHFAPPPPEYEHRLASPVGRDFSDVSSKQVIAVSQDFVELCDKYGVAFSSELSELFSYTPANIWELPDELRVFRFADVTQLRYVQQGFMSLVDAWLDVYAPLHTVKTVNAHELVLMRELLMNFIYLTAGEGDMGFGWSAERKLLVTYMFTPPGSRIQLSSNDRTVRERLRLEQGWKLII